MPTPTPERVTDGVPQDGDLQADTSLRPKRLAEYVNQDKVKSNLNYDNNKRGAQTDVLVGLGDSGNLVGFYENETYSARLAYNWRGKFLAANFGGVEGAQPLYVEPFGQLDVSLGYNFTPQLRFQFEAINLTDEYTRTHMRNENQMGAVTQLGRRIMIGARYKF